MNADLPQFNASDPSNNWTEVTSSYDLSAFLFSIPVALQVFTTSGKRTTTTGLLTGTWDEYEQTAEDEWKLVRSVFSFQEAEALPVVWSDVHGVLVMVATPFEKPEGEANAE